MPTARVGDIDICYEILGDGAPLLLIMGIGAQMINWPDGLCELLVGHGFRVIRFDNRDTGLSSKLDHMGRPRLRELLVRGATGMPMRAPYTLGDMAADAAGLLDALGIERAHVVGASMGGMIAQILALEHAGRVHSLTSLMSHPGDLRSKLSVKPAVMRAFLAPVPRDPEAAVAHQLAVLRTLSGPGHPFDEEHMRAVILRTRERSFHPPGFLRQLAAIMAAPSRVRVLRRVRAPTLVMHGTADPLVPPVGGRATARAIPGARLHWIQGMGHDLPRSAWPELADAIAAHARAAGGPGHTARARSAQTS